MNTFTPKWRTPGKAGHRGDIIEYQLSGYKPGKRNTTRTHTHKRKNIRQEEYNASDVEGSRKREKRKYKKRDNNNCKKAF